MTTSRTPRTDPVGVTEIADRLDVRPRTVHMWIYRSRVPPPEFTTVNGSRAWEWRTILRWAGDTGRLRTPDMVAEYERRFRRRPQPPTRGGRPRKETADAHRV
jgi:hypothetical protein